MEDFKQRAEFRRLLRLKLTELLSQFGYNPSFDNQNEDQSISKNWVFRLQYVGKKKIEIHNDDYRDYTGYFRIKVNDKEIFLLNLDRCESIETAFEEIKEKLIDKI
ncbi:MAG: hypothetical protein ABUL44_04375 [Flavobacterium sp.]